MTPRPVTPESRAGALALLAMSDGAAPSGQQWTVSTASDEFTVCEVGGTLRSWVHDGREVLAGFDPQDPILAGRGQQLLPWPNRIRDGRYVVGGVERQLPLTEVGLGNASHGLVRWVPWSVVDLGEASLTVGTTLRPQPGWDWTLALTTTYAVSRPGLSVTTVATNLSDTSAPFGGGWHPYVAIGDAAVENVRLTLPAAEYAVVDDRLLPVGIEPVDASVDSGPGTDFRAGREIGTKRLDTAYTGLSGDDDGRWRVRVDVLEGPTHVVWGDLAAFPWVQVFTGKAEAGQPEPHGIAVEPMTCPADAFNSGRDLVMLEPGQSWTGTWGIEAPVWS